MLLVVILEESTRGEDAPIVAAKLDAKFDDALPNQLPLPVFAFRPTGSVEGCSPKKAASRAAPDPSVCVLSICRFTRSSCISF